MRALIQQVVHAATPYFDVWFVNDDIRGRRREVAYFEPQEDGPAKLCWREADEAGNLEPTLRLSLQTLDILRYALDEYGPTSTDAVALARDAVKVRDRLLTLVEHVVKENGDA